jgi:hypothetical protein
MTMRRFVACSGVRGRSKALSWLRRLVEKRRPDGVLFAGGVLDRGWRCTTDTAPCALTRDEAIFVEKFFQTVGGLGVFSAIIPGPADAPLDEFLRLGMAAEVEFPGLHIVHATPAEKGDVIVCGMGGCVVDGPAAELDVCSRTRAEYQLRPMWTARQPRKVLLLARPPTGALGGEKGSRLIAELVDSFHPSLCVVAGPSERRGTRRMASTLVVNPGYLAEGWAAWLDWGREADDRVELLDLRDLDRAGLPADLGVCD